MNNRITKLVPVLALTLFLCGHSQAGQPTQVAHFGKALMSLDLTETQLLALSSFRSQFMQRAQDAGNTWRGIRAMLESGEVDAAADVAASAAREHIYFLHERKTILASVLSAEQMAALEAFLKTEQQPSMHSGRPW